MARLRLILAVLALVALGLPTSAQARHLTLTGASSWYGGSCDGSDNNIPKWAPSDHNRTPGIALRRYDTRRGFFLLTLIRTGRRVVVWHSDYGPNGWTGKLVDLNYRAVQALGYSGCQDDYPTWARVRITLLHGHHAIRAWIRKTKTQLDDRYVVRRL